MKLILVPSVVVEFFTSKFGLDLSILSDFELLEVTILANIYWLIFWGIIVYFVYKLFNRLYLRIF